MPWSRCSGSRPCTRTTHCGPCVPPSRCETPLPAWARSRPGSASTPATCWPPVPPRAIRWWWVTPSTSPRGWSRPPRPARCWWERPPGRWWRMLPTVGRATELGLVRLTADRTAQLRRPHLVTMLGQPGIGKSRLASELQHAEEATTLAGHCRATASASPLEPLLEAARAAIPDGLFTESAVAALMPGDPEVASVTACLADADNAGAVDLSWAASRLVGAMADTGMVMILFEDVHWAEDALLDAIEHLADRRRRRSLLVVCTARPEFVDRRTGWGAGANTLSFALERLNDAETRHLLLGASPGLPADHADRVVAAAEGNPLFA